MFSDGQYTSLFFALEETLSPLGQETHFRGRYSLSFKGVGYTNIAVKSCSVAQSCQTLGDPMHYSPSGFPWNKW